MATNGTGVNEAIAVVLKAAKAVAGENWSENERSENGSERSEKKETFMIEMQEKVKKENDKIIPVLITE